MTGTIEVDGVLRPTHNSAGILIHATDLGIRNFWRWFGNSKTVDGDGRPLVVFHGTKAKFTSFDEDRITEGGFFFSAERSAATRFGHHVLSVYLALKKPLVVAGETLPVEHSLEDIERLLDQAAAEGCDGIVILGFRDMNDRPVNTTIAFHCRQIKSIVNSGAFNPLEPSLDDEAYTPCADAGPAP